MTADADNGAIGLSPEQQELIDLLRNEIAELIDGQMAFDASDQNQLERLLFTQHMQCENFAGAAELVGLMGLAHCCQQIDRNVLVWLETPATMAEDSLALLMTWPIYVLGYLQYIDQTDETDQAVADLVAFLQEADWPNSLLPEAAQTLLADFAGSAVTLDDDTPLRPSTATAEMVCLQPEDDVNLDLLDGLLQELPQQAAAFSEAILVLLNERDWQQLDIAQRQAHTIKGAANVVDICGLANLMHHSEDILQALQKYGQWPSASLAGLLLQMADALEGVCEQLLGIGQAPPDLLQILQELLDWANYIDQHGIPNDECCQQLAFIRHPAHNRVAETVPVTPLPDDDAIQASSERINSRGDGLSMDSNLNHSDLHHTELNHSDFSHSPLTDSDPLAATGPLNDNPFLDRSSDRAAVDREAASEGDAANTVAPNGRVSNTATANEGESFLRVPEEKVQELLRLAGEDTIANNRLHSQVGRTLLEARQLHRQHQQIQQLAQDFEQLVEVKSLFSHWQEGGEPNPAQAGLDPLELERYGELHSFSHQLQEVTTDLREMTQQLTKQLSDLQTLTVEQSQLIRQQQQLLLETRMVPVQSLASRLQRCVRQVCRLTGKEAELVINGLSVLIDSRVLSELTDPLMHLLRNAVDHGLESSEQRRANGKSRQGTIELTFRREGESILVSCWDDGAGLDQGAIYQKALARGLVTPEQTLSGEQIQQLILQPGFSTRDNVSQISGRGIGLDAVAAKVADLKGSLVIDSESQRGTSFSLTLPVSLLSSHSLLVRCGEQQISITNRNLQQIVYLQEGELTTVGEQQVYQTDRYLCPVTPLPQLLPLLTQNPLPASAARVMLLVDTGNGERQGVLVDEVLASRDIVVKPFNRFTYRAKGVIGATILGDGGVSPVVDLVEVLQAHLTLPMAVNQPLSAPSVVSPASQPAAVALVVDDSLSARRSLAQFVADIGFEVKTAKDGFEAISIIEQAPPSLLLVDLEMPRMNGLELTAHVRAQERTRDLPVIMITSRMTDKHRQLASAAGVDSYLSKPFSDDELLQKIQLQMAG